MHPTEIEHDNTPQQNTNINLNQPQPHTPHNTQHNISPPTHSYLHDINDINIHNTYNYLNNLLNNTNLNIPNKMIQDTINSLTNTNDQFREALITHFEFIINEHPQDIAINLTLQSIESNIPPINQLTTITNTLDSLQNHTNNNNAQTHVNYVNQTCKNILQHTLSTAKQQFIHLITNEPKHPAIIHTRNSLYSLNSIQSNHHTLNLLNTPTYHNGEPIYENQETHIRNYTQYYNNTYHTNLIIPQDYNQEQDIDPPKYEYPPQTHFI